MSENPKELILKTINENFKGLEFDYIEYNSTYEDYEIHFKGGKYFTLGVHLHAEFRQIYIAKRFRVEGEESEVD